MSEAMGSMGPTQRTDTARMTTSAQSHDRAQSASLENSRPALVTFAAVLMFVSAAFSLVWAIQEFSSAVWIKNNLTLFGYGNMTSYLWAWGIVDLILAAIAIYAAIDVLRGGVFGLVIGLIMAGVSATRWFFYIPEAPLTALAIIALDVLVIYGLIAGSGYFVRAQYQ